MLKHVVPGLYRRSSCSEGSSDCGSPGQSTACLPLSAGCRCSCSSSHSDTLSINSSLSSGSSGSGSFCHHHLNSSSGLGPGDFGPASRCSSTMSLVERPHTIPIKIFAKVLRTDIEYVTVSINPKSTTKDVVQMVLNKSRMKHRDPKLFYLTMEITLKQNGVPVRTLMHVDNEARPAELQHCHPIGHSRFNLQMRQGGVVKVCDGVLVPGSQYKSLLVSDRTTSEELVQLLINCAGVRDRSNNYALYEVGKTQTYERKVATFERPLLLQQEWPCPDHFAFELRKCPHVRPIVVPWSRITDTMGAVSFRLTRRDEVSPRKLYSPTLKQPPTYNDYENFFYI